MASTASVLRALMSGDRLALIIALIPQAADVIPRGPQRVDFSRLTPGSEVSLNPQPLPPKELQIGARLMNNLVAAALAQDSGIADSFIRDIDDWCGTGWPRRWPKHFPVGGPQPDPWQPRLVLLGGALAAADIAAHYDDPATVEVLDRAVEMLTDRAVG